MAKQPSLQFYPGDWLRDNVSSCSLAAQGLWLRMMFIAHESAHYGFLEVNGSPMTPEMIARRCGCSLEEWTVLFAELEAVGVPSRAANGSIYSRRMNRDASQRTLRSKIRSEAGKAGASARWQNDGKTMANAIAKPMANDMAKNGSSSSSSCISDLPINAGDIGEIPDPTFGGTWFTAPDENFLRWWDCLPPGMKQGQQKCWELWPGILTNIQAAKSLPEDIAIQFLIDRTRLFAKSPRGRQEKFRWAPKTFLEDGHYNDDPAAWELQPEEKPRKPITSAVVRPVSAIRTNAVGGIIHD